MKAIFLIALILSSVFSKIEDGRHDIQSLRAVYHPKVPYSISGSTKLIEGKATHSVANQEEIKKLFPNTYGMPILTFEPANLSDKGEPINVGVILSGGQAPGGHNVISGIFDGIKAINKNSKLYGFLNGPSGLVNHDYIELTEEIIDEYRNTGGFDIIGSGRTKLEEESQFDKGLEICKKLGIKAIVIIGGDDSNTNACVLAEYYLKNKSGIQVIGVPKTIDGDLKNEMIEASFGFDTATKVYSEVIGNIERDANSAKKYWHFIKLMGRSASHVALEVALQTQPNIALIGEEVEAKKQSLDEIVEYIANIVALRAKKGKNFGIALVPEGLIEFIPEMKVMISSLNDILAHLEKNEDYQYLAQDKKYEMITSRLDEQSAKLFTSLPSSIKAQLLMDRDPHGNVQVSRIETEKLLIEMVKTKLNLWKTQGRYSGKFSDLAHFFGYEGRCAMPSNFDADYCYSLGYNAFALIQAGLTGYLSSIKNTTKPASEWVAGGVPLTMMMNMERRHGEMKPVIKKALVELDGPVFKALDENREKWAMNDCYVFPGSIQYFGPSEVCDVTTITLQLEQERQPVGV